MTNKLTEKRDYWANHVKAWKASGETQSSYCRRHQLKPHQMTYWKSIFENDTQTAQADARLSNGFVSVQMAARPIPQGLTIRLPNGLQLEGVHIDNLTLIQEIIGWQI